MKKGFTPTPKYIFNNSNINYGALVYGFTLIELLVVISIIGILVALSVFGLQGARKASRDAIRKADLETIRSGLGMYKADCDTYPGSLNLANSIDLNGTNPPPAPCSSSNAYITASPVDPMSPTYKYLYASLSSNSKYEICAHLEQGLGSVTCGGSNNCGSANTCNYKVISP